MAKNSIDLHGYKVDDALEAVDRFIMKMNQSDQDRGRIITGKGTGAIQKAVIAYIKKAGFHWEYERMKNGQKNTGVIVLFFV